MGEIINILSMANREDNLQEIMEALQEVKDALVEVLDQYEEEGAHQTGISGFFCVPGGILIS